MAKLTKWFLITTFIVTACNNVDVTRYVDPNIGGVATLLTTKNPTVHRPHGMIRVFPVTKPGLTDRYLSDKIYGFAVSMPAYRNGHVTELMATKGTISASEVVNASTYDHDLEEVHPWHHKLWLEDQNIITDWTQSGWMPTFPQFYGDFPAMIGFHSAALMWDTYQKGGTGFDVGKGYEGLKKSATSGTMLPWRASPMCSIDSFYIKNGWYPALPEGATETEPMMHSFEKRQSVAVTLEHSYDDWCLAQLAKALGKTDDYNYFSKRAQNYRNVFNPATGFMAPKMADGNWVKPFDPQLSGGIGSRIYFAENNAYIWNFSVMHDIPGLIQLLGGAEPFTKRLDNLFNEPTKIDKWQFMGQFPDATGLNGMFPAGNEPSFHVPYLYNYAGKPWKTQRRIREVMEMWFDDTPLGLPGDEDGGALCSWYVFSAMGFYPVTPGNGLYAIGSPFFKKVQIKLPNGIIFTVKADNVSKQNKYIQSAQLNGEELNRAWIKHSEITEGGTLEFTMGDRPN